MTPNVETLVDLLEQAKKTIAMQDTAGRVLLACLNVDPAVDWVQYAKEIAILRKEKHMEIYE